MRKSVPTKSARTSPRGLTVGCAPRAAQASASSMRRRSSHTGSLSELPIWCFAKVTPQDRCQKEADECEERERCECPIRFDR
jgi:hypothetical protein